MKRIALLFALLLTTATFTTAAHAGYGCSVESERVWKNLDAHMARSLRMPQIQIRAQIMKNITYFAKECPEKITFRRVLTALREIHKRDEDPAHRALALAALRAVNESTVMGENARRVTGADGVSLSAASRD